MTGSDNATLADLEFLAGRGLGPESDTQTVVGPPRSVRMVTAALAGRVVRPGDDPSGGQRRRRG